MREARFIGLLFTMALAFAACTAALGVEQLPRAGSVLDAGPEASRHAEPACESCVAARCAVEEEGCARDRPCAELAACLAACKLGDVACRAFCESTHAQVANEPLFRAFDGCRRLGCPDSCYGPDGLGFGHAAKDPACKSCFHAECKDRIAGCIQSGKDRPGARIGDCERAIRCINLVDIVNPDTSVACYYGFPDGEAELDAVKDCLEATSCTACAIGRDFACIDRYRWRGRDVDGATFVHRLNIREYALGTPPKSTLTARACDAIHCASETPCEDSTVPAAHTTPDGTLDISVPNSSGRGFTGCIWMTGEGYVPTLVQYDRPVVFREGALNLTAFPTESLATVAAHLNKTLDPTRGQLVTLTSDCTHLFAPGLEMRLTTDPSRMPFYYRNGRLETLPPTDATGLALFLDVKPGEVDAVARTMSDARDVSHARARIVKGAISLVWMVPDPLSD